MSDLISRDAVMLRVREFIGNPTYNENMLVADLNALPSAEPERKKGQWIIRYYDNKSYETKEVNYNPFSLSNPCGIAYCSECGAHPLLNGHEEDVYSKYCPNCGAEMMNRGE